MDFENISLIDLIPLEDLQNLQDRFSDSFNIPAIIHDKAGKPLTRPSMSSEFCELVRSTKKGLKECRNFDAKLDDDIKKNKQPILRAGCVLKSIYTAATPIFVNNMYLGNFSIGQVIDKAPEKAEIRELAQRINLSSNLLELKIKSLIPADTQKLKKAVKFLEVLTNQISTLAYESLKNRMLLDKEKHYKEELAATHANFKSVFYNKHLAYTIIGKDYKVIDFNEPAAINAVNTFGFPLEKGINIFKFVHESDKSSFLEYFEYALNGKFRHIEKQFESPSGKKYWYKFDFVPMEDQYNRIDKVCFVVLDVSHLKQFELQSLESERLYKLLAENASDVIWMTDLKLNFSYLSPSTEKLFGYTREERRSIPLEEIITKESYAQFQTEMKAGIEDYKKTGVNKTHLLEVEGIHKTGARIYFEVVVRFILDKDGSIEGLQGASRDITKRKFNELTNEFILDLYRQSEDIDSEGVLNRSINKAVELTQSHYGFFHFVSPDSLNVRQKIWSDDALKDCRTESQEENYPIDQSGIWSDSVREKRAKIFNRFPLAVRKKTMPDNHLSVERLLTVPVFQGNDVVAVLGVSNKAIDYSDFDVKLLIHLATNVWNIVRRKRAEYSFRKLHKAVQSSKACIIITDDSGNIEYANPFFTESTGYSREEYMNKNPRILRTDYHDKSYYDNLWKTITSGKTWEGEFLNRKKNGDLYWEQAVISPVTNTSGKITHYVGVKTDITALKNISEELKKAKEIAEDIKANTQAIIENTNDSIWAVDRNYNLTYVNQSFKAEFEKQFGESLEIGDSPITKLPPNQQKKWLEVYRRAFSGERFIFEQSIPAGESKMVYISVAVNPIKIEDTIVGASFFGRNITQEKLHQKELIKAKNKADESNRLKTAFLNNISHEFRTPMNGILGFSNLLIQGKSDEAGKLKYANVLQESCNRLLDIVEDTVEISKVQSNATKAELEFFDLSDIIRRALEYAYPKSEKKGIEIQYAGECLDNEILIFSDWNKIFKSLKHLLENAVKFTHAGLVKLECQANDSTVIITVSDTGIGIQAEVLEKIFQPFWQVELQLNRNFGGNGIGLTLAKSYAELLGGSISISSTPGEGTTVSFEIPLRTEI